MRFKVFLRPMPKPCARASVERKVRNFRVSAAVMGKPVVAV
jgi:hypothetical protein